MKQEDYKSICKKCKEAKPLSSYIGGSALCEECRMGKIAPPSLFILADRSPVDGDCIKAYTQKGEFVGRVKDDYVVNDDCRYGPLEEKLCRVEDISKWRFATGFDY